jgi:hypothetical protein
MEAFLKERLVLASCFREKPFTLDLSLVMELGPTGSVTGQTATVPLRRTQPGHRRVSPSCHCGRPTWLFAVHQ